MSLRLFFIVKLVPEEKLKEFNEKQRFNKDNSNKTLLPNGNHVFFNLASVFRRISKYSLNILFLGTNILKYYLAILFHEEDYFKIWFKRSFDIETTFQLLFNNSVCG